MKHSRMHIFGVHTLECELWSISQNDDFRVGTRASAKRAPKTITNPNVPSESIFYKLSDFVLEIFLRGHLTEKIDFKW